jgi:uncharacterized protein involved in tolerance to divalent cations
MAQNFTLPGQGSTITLPQGRAFIVLATVLLTGSLTCFAFIFAAVLVAAYLLNLAIAACVELATHMAAVYTHADSLSKILLWLAILYIALKAWPRIRRSLAGVLVR